MRVFQIGLDDRLGRTIPSIRRRETEVEYVLIIHRGDDTLTSLGYAEGGEVPEGPSELATCLSEQACRGVLYLRGAPFAGVPASVRNALRERWSDRLHFLSYAIDAVSSVEKANPVIAERFSNFIALVEGAGRIVWNIIDPAVNEGVLAAYLMACAVIELKLSEEHHPLVGPSPVVERMFSRAAEELRATHGVDFESRGIAADTAEAIAVRLAPYITLPR